MALVALVGPVVLLLAFGVGASVTFGAQRGGVPDALRTLVPGALAPLPAEAWVDAALGLLLYGLRARWAVVGWALLGVFLLLGPVGELLELPGWWCSCRRTVTCPRPPAESFALAPELVLTAVAAALAGAFWGYRARDVG